MATLLSELEIPVDKQTPYYDLIFPFDNPAELLMYSRLKWGDELLMPVYNYDDDNSNIQKITRLHEMCVWTSSIIVPQFKNRFEIFTLGLNQMLSNYSMNSSTSGEESGSGSLSKTGGESFTHGESVATTQSGSTVTTYRTSTGENASPRFDREVEVSDSDPTVTHSGTDYKKYKDSEGNPYTESKSSSSEKTSTTTTSGYKLSSLPDEYKKIINMQSKNIFDDWLYTIISAISSGIYR